MRAMPIRIITGRTGLYQMKASFKKNWKHYLQEALGLAIFMISACFFGTLLESQEGYLHHLIADSFLRLVLMGLAMGTTALFIFYSPLTAPSGAHINPAVSLGFLRIGKMCPWDFLFYCLFQAAGGITAVYIMQLLLGTSLINPPVNSVATVPVSGTIPALVTEFSIAFATMAMVLFTSHHPRLKKFTRIFAACMVVAWVILAGPVSGFGMNPARSFASALPANIWTDFWIYLLAPVAGMLSAAEFFLLVSPVTGKKNSLNSKMISL
jgi:aquaporin Z